MSFDPQKVIALAAPLIRAFEGLRLTTYDDATGTTVYTGGRARGVLTIGYGTTRIDGKPLVAGMSITEAQAEQYLLNDVQPLLALLTDKPVVAAAAYVSFGYNLGINSLKTVLAGQGNLINYAHSGTGAVLPGLVTRRTLEAALIAAVS